MKLYLVRNKIEVSFILLQTILYGIFLNFDIADVNAVLSCRIKFGIILVCFCYVIIYCKGRKFLCNSAYNRSIIFCMIVGLLFTVISDFFILILDHYIYGVITFIIVQQLYGIRIIMTDKNKWDGEDEQIRKRTPNNIFIYKYLLRVIFELIAAFSVCIILKLCGVVLEVLLVISVFYFVCITTNAITAVRAVVHNPKKKENLLFAVGMVLFLFCDINVGIFNMSGYISMPEQLYHVLYAVSSILMWTFYAPAQVLISLSVSRMCKY